MSDARQLRLALAIKRVAPFSQMSLPKLFIVAGVVAVRRYPAGATIFAQGSTPEEVHIPIEGQVESGTAPVDHAFDLAGVAFDRPVTAPFRAGAQGCTTVTIGKSHVFTLLRECPELSLAMVGLADGRCGG